MMKLGTMILLVSLFTGCGENVWRPDETNSNVNESTLWEAGEHELTPEVEQVTIHAGQTFTITDTIEKNIPINAKVTLRFKARTHTDIFAAGSYAFLQVNLDNQPLTRNELNQEADCYQYPLCDWDRPTCAETCHEWIFDSFTSDLSCEGEDFVSPSTRENILALQISPNFENHLLRDNPNTEEVDDNRFFVDPEVSGNPYQFEFDLSEMLQGFQGEFNLNFINPMTEYAGYMRCIVRRDSDYWQGDSLQFVRVALGEVQLFIDVPETPSS